VTESWGLTLGVAVVIGAYVGLPAIPLMVAGVVAVQVLRRRFNALFLGVAVAAALLGVARAAMQEHQPAPAGLADSQGAYLTVDSLPRTSAAGNSVLATVHSLRVEDVNEPVEPFNVLVWLPDGAVVAPGDQLSATWSVESVDTVAPGYARYLRSQGASGVGRVWWFTVEREGSRFFHGLVRLRYRISDGLRDVIPGDAGALAAGIVTGDDSALDEETREAFLRTGTAHITAVSGSNVAMVLAIWNLLIPAGRNRRLLAVQMLIIVSIWLYALLVGLEPPALRAAIMASLVLAASRFGRRPDLLTLLALTSAGMVLRNPEHVRMVAFWLSVIATGAIISRIPTYPGVGTRSMARGMLEGVALAQIATLPIILITFGTWSFTSVVANALLSPLMWIAFPLCFVLAGIVIVAPWLASVVAIVPLIPLEVSLQIVRALSTVVPPVDLHGAGLPGQLAIGIPCLLGFLLLAGDAQRWGRILVLRSEQQPLLAATAIVAPTIGLLVGLVLAVVVK